MTAPAPAWLAPDDVRNWLTSSGAAVLPEPGDVGRVCESVALFCQGARWEFWNADRTVYTPDAEVKQAAIMLAARVIRRRNSPGGIEQFGTDGLVSYVARFDPDIERSLRLGSWARPAVG